MSKVRVCFLGTPDFAAQTLKALIQDEHYEVVGVVTQPDRPSGRKMQLTASPVKSLAMASGLRVISPESVNKDIILDELQKWGAEVAVVVAFGQILSEKFLKLFPFGAVNIHGSLLPRWRGAAPIQRSIEFGDTESGVALQKVVKALDAGDVIGVRRVALDSEINATQLYEKLADLGCELLQIELMDYVRGNLVPVPQSLDGITYAKKIEKAESRIQWSSSAVTLHNKIRAFTMGPGTWTTLNEKKIKIHKTRVMAAGVYPVDQQGQVIQASDSGIDVATGDGILRLIEIQPESRNRLSAKEALAGKVVQIGDRFV